MAEAAPALLEVRDLSVAFGAKTVVEGVSLAIAPGEKLALVGESGSGKTVTALSLLRLLHDARVGGSAWFDDGRQRRELLALPERELRGLRGDQIAMIFQIPRYELYCSMNLPGGSNLIPASLFIIGVLGIIANVAIGWQAASEHPYVAIH